MTAVPDYVPMLTKGASEHPKLGGCLVQVANWLYDPESWTDSAYCVDVTLTAWGITINDLVSDDTRHQLALLAPRLSGTRAATRGEEIDTHAKLNKWIKTNPAPVDRRRVPPTNTWGPHGLTIHCHGTTFALIGEEADAVAWLTALIDEFDRITGRAPVQPLTPERWTEVKELVGQ